MKKIVFLLLLSSPFLFGFSYAELYIAYSDGHDIASKDKQEDVLKYKRYCIDKYGSGDMSWYCTVGAVSGKNGIEKPSYQEFLKMNSSK